MPSCAQDIAAEFCDQYGLDERKAARLAQNLLDESAAYHDKRATLDSLTDASPVAIVRIAVAIIRSPDRLAEVCACVLLCAYFCVCCV